MEHLQFSKLSGAYRLYCKQELPVSIEEAWDFFSNPSNLEKITPGNLRFQITSKDVRRCFPGQIITYTIRLNKWIKMSWVTEISHVKDFEYFIDEQRFGPYKMWHHLHRFTPTENGILMEDVVHFRLPFHLLSGPVYKLYVRRNLQKIFGYRYKKLGELFKM